MKLRLPRALTLGIFAALPLAFLTVAAPAQDWAKARLDASPAITNTWLSSTADRTVQAFVVYPEVKSKAPVVILIHEIFGLSDWAKEMADELAGAGLHRRRARPALRPGPNGGGSSEFPSQDAAVKAVSGLIPTSCCADLDAAADYGKKLPAANGKIAVAGFCWGGGKSFAFATHRKDLSAPPSSSTGPAQRTCPPSLPRLWLLRRATTRASARPSRPPPKP